MVDLFDVCMKPEKYYKKLLVGFQMSINLELIAAFESYITKYYYFINKIEETIEVRHFIVLVI